MEAMDQVVLGIGTPSAIFRSPTRTGFVIELRAEGLRVERHVYMLTFDWDNLGAFFSKLAESWRGFDGELSWHSVEHDLTIVATSDNRGHCMLEFTVRGGPNYTWRAKVGDFTVDAGEDMAALARSIHGWAAR